MNSDWREVRLGEVLAPSNEKLGPHDQEPVILSLSKYEGFVRAEDYFDKRIASAKLDTYKVVPPDGWAYSTIHIDEGSIARNTLGMSGVISPMYTTMRWIGQAHDPAFFERLLTSPALLRNYSDSARGSVNRRRSLPIATFEAIRVLVPPLEVQRRIVDLVAAVDADIHALAAEALAGADAVAPLLHTLLTRDTEGVESLPLGEVGEFIRGRRFTKHEYVPTGLGCIHYGQIHTHFGPVARESLTYLPEESRSRLRLAQPGDVVIAATSEDVDGLGKATVWLGEDDVAVHDDCYIFRHRLDPKFASYVFASPWFQHQKKQYAGGTKVTRISGSDLARIAIPIPPIAVQVRIGEALGALSDHENAVRLELEAVRQFRASMLAALLSGRVEIPESYEALLNRVADEHLEAS